MTRNLELQRYYNPKWFLGESIPQYNMEVSDEAICQKIRESLTKSVEKRLMADVPFGVLLSGGLDSSLTSSIASKLVKEGKNKNWGSQLHSFSIGLEGAPDLLFARKVANHLQTIHHEFHFTVEEGIDAIRDVINHLETYDVTTIRASTPMFLLSRKIKAMGIKMVLSGEGADEIYGGYLYFHKAPNDEIFHQECCKRVKNLHYFDCLRANKSTMAWGLEVRVPFLDKEFLNISMPIRPEQKMKNIEKYILRKAFDQSMTDGEAYLPTDVLWRQKEQFSDGVGYNWIDSLVRDCEEKVNDEDFSKAEDRFPHNTPKTKEAFYFRTIFDEYYPNCERVSEFWVPNTDWEGVNADPSGRSQGVHNQFDETF
jgi:asparagine synthase (glutamine-hydrolysing)